MRKKRLQPGDRVTHGKRSGTVVKVADQPDPYLARWGLRRQMEPYYVTVRLEGNRTTTWLSSADLVEEV